MSALKLINGKFWKNGKVVPPTFGDKDQIQLMTAYERMITEGTDAYPVEDSHEEIVGWSVDCFCGREVVFEDKEDMDGWTKTCLCGLRYVCNADEDNFITIKLKPKKS